MATAVLVAEGVTPEIVTLVEGAAAFALFLQKIQLLAGEVARFVDDGALNRMQGNPLTVKLEAAAAQLEKGNPIPAANMLRAFANEVAALEISGRLSSSEATLLIEWAGNIINQID